MLELVGRTDAEEPDEYQACRAAVLCAQLPQGARVRQAENENELWGIDEQLMRLIEYDIRALIWAVAAKKGTRKPEPIELPKDRKAKELDAAKLDAAKAEVDAALGFLGGDEDEQE